jgi:hypothetical protein
MSVAYWIAAGAVWYTAGFFILVRGLSKQQDIMAIDIFAIALMALAGPAAFGVAWLFNHGDDVIIKQKGKQ